VGAPGLGELSSFTFQQFPLSVDQTAEVNVTNGNLIVKANDASIAVPGFGLRQDRFYNGLSTNAGSMGGGWESNNDVYDVGIDDHGTYTDFYGPNGVVERFTLSGSTYVAPPGSNMTLTHPTSAGTFAWIVTMNRTGEKYEFDSAGRISATYDRNGVGEFYNLSLGQAVFVDSADINGPYLTFNWDDSGVLNSMTDSANRTTTYTYDGNSRLWKVAAPDGALTTYTYDSVGRLSTITLPSAANAAESTVVTFGYDSASRVTSVTQNSASLTWGSAADIVTHFTYNSAQTVVTDPNSHPATYNYDTSGRVTSTSDALSRARSQTWTANSDIASTTDALGTGSGHTATYTFDANNNTTSAALPTGAAASATYASGTSCSGTTGTAYQMKCSTDSSGNKQAYQYDGNGNMTQQADTTSGGTVNVISHTYNGATPSCGGFTGQVCSATDGNGHTTTYQYDAHGDMTTVTQPAPLGTTTYTYDSLNRVHTVTDGNGKVTTYGYDLRDRPTSTAYNTSGSVTTAYYKNGLTKTVSDASGGATAYQYDAQGHITQQTGPTGSTPQKLKYDAVGNLTSYADGSNTTTYKYDAANQLASMTDPGGTCPASGIPAANSGCTQFTYDNDAAETKRTYPGGATVATTRDAADRATRITAKNASGAIVADVGYSYAAAGADRELTQSRTAYLEQGVTAGAVTSYGYDSQSRLTSAIEKSGATTTASWTYGYDGAGNRTTQTRAGATGTTAGTITSTYNAANEITSTTTDTSTWTYDAVGEQTKNGQTATPSTFGDRHQLTQLGTTTETYFGDGNTARVASGSTTFQPSALGLVHSTAGSAATQFVRTNSGALVDYAKSSARHYYVLDALGSVIGLLSSAGAWEGGYSYSPYGESRATSTATVVTSNPLRYIGGEFDGGALYKLGARYYDASAGRFTQPDPSGQELNPYAYSSDDPIDSSDPSGRLSVTTVLKLIAAISEGKDVYEILGGAESNVGGIEAAFALTCSIAAGAIAADTGPGIIVAELGCVVLDLMFNSNLEDSVKEH
jgi:RHS repeat-associated protein